VEDTVVKVKHLFFGLGIFISGICNAQIPEGYYNGTEGLTGEALRSALFGIINEHTELSYTSLWTHFQATDKKDDGKVWDMYSDIPGGTPAYTYTFVTDQCGNYGAEGDCYNREHSFPKSWFNDATPMLTDLFHIFPTDGYVNGMRSNYPYGEVGTANWTSTNGSRLGNCTFTGYTGVVFEPIDEYKGDFARTYFYMVTCYLDQVSSWSSPMISGNGLSVWAEDMLVEWSNEDPVSEKETDRNDSVYEIQNNRNPYIDHPEWIGAVWGFPAGVTEMPHPGLKAWYSAGQVHITLPEAHEGDLLVSNAMGQVVSRFRVDDSSGDFPIDLGTGVYMISFISNDLFLNRKIIVSGH
jgi:endonuclease I